MALAPLVIGVYNARGDYFVTICTQHRLCILGEVEDTVVRLSEIGKTVEQKWLDLPSHHPNISLDAFVVMPNHLHAILTFNDAGSTLGTVIGGFKSSVSKTLGKSIWQRYFYDHVIRSGKELAQIRGYILTNPQNWQTDLNNVREAGRPASYTTAAPS